MATIGKVLTVTANVAALLLTHPIAVLPVKLYVVFSSGETAILLAFEALLHVYVLAPLAVKLTVPHTQTAVVPLIAKIGKVFTVIAKVAVFPKQPNALAPLNE